VPDATATSSDRGVRLTRLQHEKQARLKDLLKLKPGQKHYRRTLKAYLEADSELQRIIIDRLGLDFRL
jgi:hypothetical protein